MTIFIKPESIENLKKRLVDRDPNIPQSELQKRLENAKKEIENEERFYDYTVVNEYGKLNEAVNKVAEIIKKHSPC